MTSDTFGAAYGAGIRRTIAFLLGRGVPRDFAEDIAQSAWSRGWEKLAQLRDDAMLTTWVNTIALNHYRRIARYVQREQSWDPAYLDVARTSIDCAAIEMTQILEACKPADRRLLKAHLSGATTLELAQAAGVSRTAMRIRLHRARRKARAVCEPPSAPGVQVAAA
jgi:RNA polymerase sigma-70 factor (ECF subfamily)